MKAKWSTEVRDGYVLVKRNNETILAGVDLGNKKVSNLDFVRDEFRKSNPTRLKALKTLEEHGYST